MRTAFLVESLDTLEVEHHTYGVSDNVVNPGGIDYREYLYTEAYAKYLYMRNESASDQGFLWSPHEFCISLTSEHEEDEVDDDLYGLLDLETIYSLHTEIFKKKRKSKKAKSLVPTKEDLTLPAYFHGNQTPELKLDMRRRFTRSSSNAL